MGGGAPDLFAPRAKLYAQARPTYPRELVGWLRSRVPSGQLCWDVATGSGQVAVLAAEHFEQVFASDRSAAQVGWAPVVEGVTYAVEPAECPSLASDSVDAILVGAAAHWLDLPAFYAEVRRVARPGAVVALFSYGTSLEGEPELQAVIERYIASLAPWWSERLALVDSAYTLLDFPFEEDELPAFSATSHGDLASLQDLLRTWSAAQQKARMTQTDPIAPFEAELRAAWATRGAPGQARELRWPIFGRVGRVGG